MNELKKYFARSTLYKYDKNPDEWFAEQNSLRQRLEDDYKLDNYGDAEMLDQVIYNTKAPAYQMQVTILKDQTNTESIRLKNDTNCVKEVTLNYVQTKFSEIYSMLQLNKGRPSSSTSAKGPVVLLATGTSSTKKKFTKPFKKDCSLCGKQGHKSVDCYTHPEKAHKNPRNKVNQKALVTTSPTRSTISCTYCQKTGHTEKNCFKKRNDQNKPVDHAHVVLFLTEHSLFTKKIPTTFSPNTFIANSGATCHMRGSLEGMFNLRPYVTDIMVLVSFPNFNFIFPLLVFHYSILYISSYSTMILDQVSTIVWQKSIWGVVFGS
jgi:hypothetical protein